MVDTWPDDGGWEMVLVIVRLQKFGERRMLPVDAMVAWGGVLRVPYSRIQIEDAPESSIGVHRAEDPWLSIAYWRSEEPVRKQLSDAAMAPQLWLLRHGEAVPHDSKPDADRELTPRASASRSPRGRGWRARARVRCLLHEPEGAGAGHGEARLPVAQHRAGDRATRSPTDSIATTRSSCCTPHDDEARVLVVGHEPSFSQVVHDLTGGRVDFKKGGVAAVRVERASGELLVLLRPRELETMAG